LVVAKIACAKTLIFRADSNRSPPSGRIAQIFVFRFIRKHVYLSPSRLDQRGASRSSRTLRRDAVGVSVLQRGLLIAPTNSTMRTVKSRRPDTPMLVSRS
jgi:hypothetical protein